MIQRPFIAAALAFAATVATTAAPTVAMAHDTWFERLPQAAAGDVLLSLGTGTTFPIYQSGIDAKYLASQGCRTPSAAAAAPAAMLPVRNEDTSLVLRARRGASSCWAQLTPFDIELPAALVPVYLHEINASDTVRAAWADMQRRGVPWKERYTKHSRIELAGLSSTSTTPAPMAMDLMLENAPQATPQTGDVLTFRLLRDGKPLAGQPLELRSELSPLGIWRQTDADGRVQVAAPLPGRWVLRGTDLRLSATQADAWESRFINLAFDVAPKARPLTQNGSSFTLASRSTSQAAAMAVITSEPPVSTTRR